MIRNRINHTLLLEMWNGTATGENSFLWNTTQQYEETTEWYMQQLKWIFRELCAVKKNQSKKIAYFMITWQNYRHREAINDCEMGVVIVKGQEEGILVRIELYCILTLVGGYINLHIVKLNRTKYTTVQIKLEKCKIGELYQR